MSEVTNDEEIRFIISEEIRAALGVDKSDNAKLAALPIAGTLD